MNLVEKNTYNNMVENLKSKLFNIGNGFDLAHGLNTRYDDFRIYLEQEYPDAEANYYVRHNVNSVECNCESCV